MEAGRITVRLVIKGNEEVVKGIARALEPDNREVPEGVSLSSELSKGSYIVTVEGPVSRISTILNIADEILELAKAAERLVD